MSQVTEPSLTNFRRIPEQPQLIRRRQWTSNQKKKVTPLIHQLTIHDHQLLKSRQLCQLERSRVYTYSVFTLTIKKKFGCFCFAQFASDNKNHSISNAVHTDWRTASSTVVTEWHCGWFGRSWVQRAMRWADCFRQLAITNAIQLQNNQKLHENKQAKEKKNSSKGDRLRSFAR